ncbi:uncharacterized protein LOC143288959 [Babylonia areolata]|uniref:uncharacterized protein LOC143288959 n=1 Tax=Babylonia areolata TaxID=304850 RepID=UPI003FD2B874
MKRHDLFNISLFVYSFINIIFELNGCLVLVEIEPFDFTLYSDLLTIPLFLVYECMFKWSCVIVLLILMDKKFKILFLFEIPLFLVFLLIAFFFVRLSQPGTVDTMGTTQFAAGILIIISLSLMINVTVCGIVVIDLEDNKTIASFFDLPAPFGPEDDVTGQVRYLVHSDACSDITFTPEPSPLPWIAMIAPGNCPNSEKVANVERAGYSAAIIHNYPGKEFPLVLTDEGADKYEVNITAVSVGYSAGVQLGNQFNYMNKTVVVRIVVTSAFPLTIKIVLIVFGTLAGMVIIVPLVISLCAQIRRLCVAYRSRKRKNNFVRRLPQRRFVKDDYFDTCAVCLDTFEVGERMRVLPCEHVYHSRCIDRWLTRFDPRCPQCMRPIVPRESGDITRYDERTPLMQDDGRRDMVLPPFLESSWNSSSNIQDPTSLRCPFGCQCPGPHIWDQSSPPAGTNMWPVYAAMRSANLADLHAWFSSSVTVTNPPSSSSSRAPSQQATSSSSRAPSQQATSSSSTAPSQQATSSSSRAPSRKAISSSSSSSTVPSQQATSSSSSSFTAPSQQATSSSSSSSTVPSQQATSSSSTAPSQQATSSSSSSSTVPSQQATSSSSSSSTVPSQQATSSSSTAPSQQTTSSSSRAPSQQTTSSSSTAPSQQTTSSSSTVPSQQATFSSSPSSTVPSQQATSSSSSSSTAPSQQTTSSSSSSSTVPSQ